MDNDMDEIFDTLNDSIQSEISGFQLELMRTLNSKDSKIKLDEYQKLTNEIIERYENQINDKLTRFLTMIKNDTDLIFNNVKDKTKFDFIKENNL